VPTLDHDALVGDLSEEYQHGRSTAWYWLQILVAIVVGSWKDIRTHRLLTLRAIGIGIATVALYFAAIVWADNGLRYLRDGILVGDHWIYWRPYQFMPIDVSIQLMLYVDLVVLHVGFLISGWVIGRLHREHGITFGIAFATFIQLCFLVLAAVAYLVKPSLRMTAEASGHTTYFSPLWMSICVVLGGYFATRRAKAV
jgi:hypothetical protein